MRIRRQLPESYPHEQQAAFIRDRHRFRWAFGGRQGGKTTLGADVAGLELYRAGRKDCPLLVVAPTYDMVRNASMSKFVQVWDQAITNVNKSDFEVSLAGGLRALFRSADNPDRIRGISASVLWGDEVAFWNRQAFEVSLGCLVATGGQALFTTTPNSYNFVYEIDTTQGPAREHHAFFRFSSLDNPGVDKQLVEAIMANMSPEMVEQEIYAGYCAPGRGRVFEQFKRRTHVRAIGYDSRLPVFVALDFGYRNPAALFLQVTSSGEIHVFDEFIANNISTPALIEKLSTRPYSKLIETIYCDPAGDAQNVQTLMSDVFLLRQAGFSVSFSTKPRDRSREAGEDRVRAALCWKDGSPRAFIDPKCERFIRSLEGYQFPKNGGRAGEKDGIHDHAADAFRYFVVNHFPIAGKVEVFDSIPWARA